MKLELALDALLPQLTAYGLRVVGVIVIFIIAWILAGWIRRAIERGFTKAQVDPTLGRFAASMARTLVLILAVMTSLSVFDVQTTSFAALIGAAGLAIGLAFQGTLGNLASGVMLLFFRPFKIGQVVKVAGELGKVDAIDLMTTTLDTFDNRRIIIPNSAVFGNVIENVSHHGVRRASVPVGTAYDADLDQVREVLEKAARSVPKRLEEPEPDVILVVLGDSSIDWEVRVWAKVEDYVFVLDRTVLAVKKHLDQAGVEIPFPQRVVHLEGGKPAEPPGKQSPVS